MNNFKGTNYTLKSFKTKKEFADKGWTLDAPNESEPTLIRAIYEQKQLNLGDKSHGFYQFADWLPIRRTLEGSAAPVTYKSEGLGKALGLSNLYITFSGYWPEKGATMKTCSFKETEAYAVLGRMPEDFDKVIVVASAGNTARSFAKVCSDNKIPLLLFVPEDNLNALWFDEPINDNVKLISSAKGSDYFDAIHLSNIACEMDEYIAEGGAKNVARRDGMGTTTLSATTTIGQIPEYYFQGVGSGTGAIAAWEANLRLLDDGRYGNTKMKLMVSQNLPFQPLYEAWKIDSRALLPLNDELARNQVETILAKVLSNRKPPYSIYGGLYDALKDSNGEVLLVNNEDAKAASKLFEDTEGIDIHIAAAVAVASLRASVKSDKVKKDSLIMLNITGGGEAKFAAEKKELYYLKPIIIFDINPDAEDVKSRLKGLYQL
ncbi:MAG: cysteate synthase [Bacteroidales bacterium]|nr:cysteate synthase [Bacteroidales bacterium]